MARKRNSTSEGDVGAKYNDPIAVHLRELVTNSHELADYLGVSNQAVNQYTLGIARPSIENLIKIADFYDTTTDYLLGRNKEIRLNGDIPVAMETTGLSYGAIWNLQSLSYISGLTNVLEAVLRTRYCEALFEDIGTYLGLNNAVITRRDGGSSTRTLKASETELFDQFIQPAMIPRIVSTLDKIRKEVSDNGKHPTENH